MPSRDGPRIWQMGACRSSHTHCSPAPRLFPLQLVGTQPTRIASGDFFEVPKAEKNPHLLLHAQRHPPLLLLLFACPRGGKLQSHSCPFQPSYIWAGGCSSEMGRGLLPPPCLVSEGVGWEGGAPCLSPLLLSLSQLSP